VQDLTTLRLGRMKDEDTVRTMWVTTRYALVTASKLFGSRWVAIVVAMLCVQGALIWVMPLLTSLARWVLRHIGVSGINLYSIDVVVTSPLAALVLVGIVGVATVFVLAEITLFAVIAHLTLDDVPLTFANVLRRVGTTIRKAASWQGLLLIPYLTVLQPISGVGLPSVLPQRIALPKFIPGEIRKTTPGAILFALVMIALVYAMLRLLLFPAIVSGGDDTIANALRRSLRMTTWRPLLGFAATMLATVLTASLVLALLAGVGILPLAMSRTHATAGLLLGIIELARLLVAGAAAAFISFFFVAYFRIAQGRSVAVRKARAPVRGTRVVSATLVVLAVFLAIPRVISASDDAALAADASTEIIGHRGYPEQAVENSIEGLRAADAAGADMVETDIQETRDGGFVMMHDVSLSRLTDDDRNVYELTEEEATALKLRQNGHTASIPTLAEFVHAADARGIRLLVDLKPHGHEGPGFARRITEQLNELDPDHTHMIQSLDRDLIEKIARLDAKRSTAYVVGFQIGDLPTTSTGAVVIENWSYHRRMLTQAHQQGRDLYTWTVNDVGDLSDDLSGGVDAVITDEVGRAIATQKRLGSGPITFYLERARGLIAIG